MGRLRRPPRIRAGLPAPRAGGVVRPLQPVAPAQVVVAAVTSTLRLADLPGNVRLEPADSGLDAVSVVDVTQLATVDRQHLDRRAGALARDRMTAVDAGLRLALRL